jgi:hypothetical protein
MEARIQSTIIADLTDPEQFNTHFTFCHDLGKVNDGKVSSYCNHSTRRIIAVKTPRADLFWSSNSIHDEAEALTRISKHDKHENTAHMLACQREFGDTFCPAIFLERAEFGNLLTYRAAWREQEYSFSSPYSNVNPSVPGHPP